MHALESDRSPARAGVARIAARRQFCVPASVARDLRQRPFRDRRERLCQGDVSLGRELVPMLYEQPRRTAAAATEAANAHQYPLALELLAA